MNIIEISIRNKTIAKVVSKQTNRTTTWHKKHISAKFIMDDEGVPRNNGNNRPFVLENNRMGVVKGVVKGRGHDVIKFHHG